MNYLLKKEMRSAESGQNESATVFTYSIGKRIGRKEKFLDVGFWILFLALMPPGKNSSASLWIQMSRIRAVERPGLIPQVNSDCDEPSAVSDCAVHAYRQPGVFPHARRHLQRHPPSGQTARQGQGGRLRTRRALPSGLHLLGCPDDRQRHCILNRPALTCSQGMTSSR